MANVPYLASALVMGLLAVGVVVLVVRGRGWQDYSPRAAYALAAGGGVPRSGLSRVASSPNTWTLAYVLVALGFLGGALVVLGGGVDVMAVIAALVAIVLFFLVAGVYIAMRGNGRPSSQAAAGSVLMLGFLFIAVISAKLIVGL